MEWAKDIVGVDQKKRGTYRSLNGAADENIFQGRASKAGFYCFFKVWRDMPYDAVLDYENVLYRVEVKGSSGNTFDVTRGTRSGKQIKRNTSRKRHLTREDCDFAVGVDSNTGDCYIIPEDIAEIIGSGTLSKKVLDDFKEKWGLFMFNSGSNILSSEQVRDGLRKLDQAELGSIINRLQVNVPAGEMRVKGTRKKIIDPKDKMVFTIWKTIAQSL